MRTCEYKKFGQYCALSLFAVCVEQFLFATAVPNALPSVLRCYVTITCYKLNRFEIIRIQRHKALHVIFENY
jgi:hypothetical protein